MLGRSHCSTEEYGVLIVLTVIRLCVVRWTLGLSLDVPPPEVDTGTCFQYQYDSQLN